MKHEPQTKAEQHLWSALKDKKLGVKFRPQGAICGYTPDFWNQQLRIAVEVDGSIHQHTRQRDRYREHDLKRSRVTIVRFTNQEVFTELDTCLSKLNAVIKQKQKRQTVLKIPKWKQEE